MRTFFPSRRRRPAKTSRPPRVRLLAELLEDRTLMSGNPTLPWSPVADSDLINLDYIQARSATNGNDPPGNGTDHGGPVRSPPGALDPLANNNTGSIGTSGFTQSEATLAAFGSTVVIGFNDSGSNNTASNKFTGFARSTDGGATFTDGGTLPTNANGDAGDPVMARHNASGRLYFATLQFAGAGVDVFESDDGGVSWSAPVQGAPGKAGGSFSQDKEWIGVDNFSGSGNGNVYLVERDFGSGNGIYFFRSTDNGTTFGPLGGTLIAAAGSGNVQGAFVTVAPDHSVDIFYFDNSTVTESIKVRKSTDQGVTFGAAVTVATLGTTGVNGDQGLVGIVNGATTATAFRSSAFPHAAVNPVNGQLYVTYADKGAGTDKADVFFRTSGDGGATWSAATRVNSNATATDQWSPTIAVSTDGGKVGVFYYSRQDDPTGDNLFKYYGSIGTVSGTSVVFAPNFAVSDTTSLPEFGRDALVNSAYMGDYNQAVAVPGAFEVSWADNRADLAGGGSRKDPNVYFKSINLGLAVSSTVPAVSATVSAAPVDYVVNFSDAINTATVAAGAFSVTDDTGTPLPADSFLINNSTQVTFHYNAAPFSTQGLHAMALAAGSVLRASDGNPLSAFTGSFRYDAVSLTVTTTSPAAGGTFTLPGPLSYVVNFNEPIDPASVGTDDLTLNVGTVTAATAGGSQATYTIGGVTAEGTLNVTLAAGKVTDVYGNPNPAPFSGSYTLDIGTVAYPVPLQALAPLGSLVYDPSTSGLISPAGDTDTFTLAVNPGQTITVLVAPTSPGLQPAVALFDPSGTSLGTATAALAGQDALLQTVAASSTVAGSYQVVVSGVGSTTGKYTVQVTLNAALENEGRIAGVTDDTPTTAQDISGSFLPLQTSLASAQRGAVLGRTDPYTYAAAAVAATFQDVSKKGTKVLQGVDNGTYTASLPFTFPYFNSTYASVSFSSNGLITFGGADSTSANSDLTSTPALAAIAPYWTDLVVTGAGSTAVFYQAVGTGSSQQFVIQWNNVSYRADSQLKGGVTFEAVLGADGSIQFNYKSLSTGRNGGLSDLGKSATAGLKDAGLQGPSRLLLMDDNGPTALVNSNKSVLITRTAATPDLYTFALGAGDTTTLAVKALAAGTVNVDLLNSAGAVVASGVAGATSVDKIISNFAIATGGAYYARVTGSGGVPYSLVVTRDAAFDTQANHTAATAQDVTGTQGVLGYLAASPTLALNASDSGWWDQTGAHSSTNKNYIAGLYSGHEDRDYFVFDLSSVNQPVTGAQLNLTNPNGYVSPDPTETYSLSDVSTPIRTLEATGTGQTAIFNDLGTGVGYGSRTVSGADNNAIVSLSLNASGVSYLNSVRGGQAAVGGAVTTLAGGGDQYIFGNTGYPSDVKQLVLNLGVPEDWYAVTLTAATPVLHVETRTPSDGPGAFGNTLNPKIELYDSAGTTLLASGTVLADGRNESLTISGLAPGTYKIRVRPENNTASEYFLGVTAAATLSAAATAGGTAAALTPQPLQPPVAAAGPAPPAADLFAGSATRTLLAMPGEWLSFPPGPGFIGSEALALPNVPPALLLARPANEATSGFDAMSGGTVATDVRDGLFAAYGMNPGDDTFSAGL